MPKRKETPQHKSPTSKKKSTPSDKGSKSASEEESSSSGNQNKFPEIDYAKFVAEFRRQQGQAPLQIAVDGDSALSTQSSPADRHNSGESSATIHENPNENVQDLVNNILSGEPSAPPSLNSPTIQISDGILLGTSIPKKIKDKIWDDEFIEMNVLTPSYVEDPVSVFISQKKFSVINNNKNKTPLTIEQWTSAFLVFMDIYIEKRPEHARSLLKYMHTIREMYDLFGDEAWRVYDERFRRLRESTPLPWGKLVDELYTKSANSLVTSRQKSSFRPPPKYPNSTLVATNTVKQTTGTNKYSYKVRTCIFYNRGEPCKQPCPFKHICHYCKGQHPRYQCGEYIAKTQNNTNATNKQGTGQHIKPATTNANTSRR